jgi:anti-sigma factor RsiW
MTADEHEQVKIMLGAYVLDLLTPADRSVVEAHLVGCVECHAHHEYLRPVPGYLQLLSAGDVEAVIGDLDGERRDGKLDDCG